MLSLHLRRLVALAPLLAGSLLWSQSSGDFAALSAAADQARQVGDAPKAIALYQQALALHPEWADGWWFLGFLEYATDQYTAAVPDFSRYIAAKPDAGPALALRGLCEYQLADYNNALQDIQSGLAHGAANDAQNATILRLHQAMLLTRAGAFVSATAEYMELATEPQMPQAALAVGMGLAGLRIAALPSEVQPDQADTAAAAGRAALLWIASAHTDAAAASAALTAFFREHGEVPNAHYMFGYLMYATSPQAALAQFQAELRRDPHHAHALAMLGWAALMDNDGEAALNWGTRAVAADPTLALGQLVVGRAELEAGDPTASLTHLLRARELEPDNLEVHLALARAYSGSNHPAEARQERQLALQMTEDHAPPAP